MPALAPTLVRLPETRHHGFARCATCDGHGRVGSIAPWRDYPCDDCGGAGFREVAALEDE